MISAAKPLSVEFVDIFRARHLQYDASADQAYESFLMSPCEGRERVTPRPGLRDGERPLSSKAVVFYSPLA